MQIQAIMASLSDKSNSVQSKVLINLRSIFNTAQENGLVAKSPVSNMLKPGGRKTPEKEALTVQESNLLLERVKNTRAKTFLLTALHTGMRRGEIVGLQWEDIDFEAKVIHLLQSSVNLVYIRDLLGHADVSTTETYARADERFKREALMLAYPSPSPEPENTFWQRNSDLMDWLKSLGK